MSDRESLSTNKYEHYSFTADEGQKPLRVDKFLKNFIQNATRSKIQKAADKGQVWVNSEPVKSNYKVKPGDVVKVMMDEPPRVLDILPEDIPIKILYEDDFVALVNKEAGMVVHPGHGNYTGTLVNALKFYFDNLPNMSKEVDRPGLVHRIDKDTSGVLVIAKTEKAMQHLAKQFKAHTTDRRYLALVWGSPKEDEGTIIGNLGRNPGNRMEMMVFEDDSQGKEAITHYKVVERFRYVTLVECRLETGRTHQIRAHFKYIGHPLFNDELYGGNRILKGTTFSKYRQFVENCFKICPRQALHAKSLAFTHPETGERISVEAPLPEDMEGLIEKWRKYTRFSSGEE